MMNPRTPLSMLLLLSPLVFSSPSAWGADMAEPPSDLTSQAPAAKFKPTHPIPAQTSSQPPTTQATPQPALAGAGSLNSRVLHFEGVPTNLAPQIKARFPFVFEREVSLAEVDDVVRFLMQSRDFSSIEVVERGSGANSELFIVAQTLRKVGKVVITGAHVMKEVDIRKILKVQAGQSFERKELLASADDLQTTYGKEGFFSPKIDIDFSTPDDNTVDVHINVTEGQPCKVMGVNFDTSNRELSLRAKHMSASLLKERLSQTAILNFQKEFNAYLADHRYLQTKLSTPAIVFNADKSLAKITYVIDNPERYELIFDGNVYFSIGDLLQAIDIESYFGVTSSPAPDVAEKIRQLYLNAGFAKVTIDVAEKSFEDLYKRQLRFTIHEGARIRLDKLEITGNISRPAKFYSGVIRDNSSDLIGLGYYNRKDIETGTKNLLNGLQNEGFLRAKVQSENTEFSKTQDAAYVSIAMDEGPLTQIRQINFNGATTFSKAQLMDVLGLHPGDPLSLNGVGSGLEKLKDFYRSHGYLEIRITNETNENHTLVSYNDTDTQANLDIEVQEGPQIVVKNVVVQGNNLTKTNVILREVDFKQGDVLTPESLGDALFRIQKLALFAKVDITTLEEGTKIAERTVVISVAERDPGIFSSGIGINNRYDETFHGFLGLGYRNLGGTGRGISGRLDLDYAADKRFSFLENRESASYLEPYLFGTHNRGRVNVERNTRVEDPTFSLATILQDNLGTDLLIEHDVSRHTLLTYTLWSFNNRRRYYRDSRDTIETENVGKIGPLFEIDYRNDPFDTTAGTYTRLDLQYADPLFGSSNDHSQPAMPGDLSHLTVQFIKMSASFTQYQEFIPKSHFMIINSVRGGYMANMSKAHDSGVPYSEMFTLGGSSTIRGFDVQKDTDRIPNIYELRPTYPGIPVNANYQIADFRMTGDAYYLLIKEELRIPIKGPFALALFYDGGGVYLTEHDVTIPDWYRDSWGFGLRINTPVGPVSADLGFKLDRKSYFNVVTQQRDYEVPWAFNLSIGNF